MASHGPTVFIVHTSADVREAVTRLVAPTGHPVVGFGSSQEFLSAYQRSARGCIIVGLVLPGISGLEFQRQLAEKKIERPVIFLSETADVHSAVEAMKAGAVDFLEVPFRSHELWGVIQKAFVLDETKLAERTRRSELEDQVSRLTPGEWRVFRLLVAGKQKKAIATELGLSTRTIEIRRTKLMRKLHASTLVDLVRIAVHLQS